MSIENIIGIAIAIGIIIISVAIYVFDIICYCFLFFDAGTNNGPNLLLNSVADNNNNNNVSTIATSPIPVTPSAAGARTKAASPPTVSPRISLFSPVMARILPLSPYRYSPMHYFTSHNHPCRLSDPVITPTKGQAEISLIAQTHSLVTLPPVCVPANETDNNITNSLKKICVTHTTNNNTKTKMITSKKPPIPCAPRRSDLHAKPAVVSLSTQTTHTKAKHAKPVNKPRVIDNGNDKNNTKSVNKYFVADTKPKFLTSREPLIPCAPRQTAAVSHFTQTNRTIVTPNVKKSKLVKKPHVVNETNNNTKSVKKYFVAEGNENKPKTLTSRKPPIPCLVSKPTAVVSLSTKTSHTKVTPKFKQAKPVKKPHLVDGTDKNNTKSLKKYFVAEGNTTKPKILTSRKPLVPCVVLKPTAVVSLYTQTSHTTVTRNGKQAKLVKKPHVVETDNTNTKSTKKCFIAEGNDTKPKVLISRKPPTPCAPRCSNLQLQTSRPTAALPLSTQTTHIKVTPKGCTQKWRC